MWSIYFCIVIYIKQGYVRQCDKKNGVFVQYTLYMRCDDVCVYFQCVCVCVCVGDTRFGSDFVRFALLFSVCVCFYVVVLFGFVFCIVCLFMYMCMCA